MAHDIKIRLFGKVFTKVMKRAAMDMNDLMAPQTNQVVGMAHRKKEKPGLPRLGHLDLFRNLFIRKSLQRPIYGGKVEACPFLYQSFIDFIGRQTSCRLRRRRRTLRRGWVNFRPY